MYKEHVYLGNSSSVWRPDKGTGTRILKNVKNKKILGFKIFSVELSNEDENLCYSNNGDCDQFCFARPEKYCYTVKPR